MPISCGALWVMSYSFRGLRVALVADNHLVSFGFRKYMVLVEVERSLLPL